MSVPQSEAVPLRVWWRTGRCRALGLRKLLRPSCPKVLVPETSYWSVFAPHSWPHSYGGLLRPSVRGDILEWMDTCS
jgi:hypothetical protein